MLNSDKRVVTTFLNVENKTVERLKTGCEPIDDLLNGGIEKGIITNVYGESGTGKTNFCIQVAKQVAENGKTPVYIDTEGGFSPERFLQMSTEEALDGLLYREATSFEEQIEVIKELEDLNIKNLGLIVVDSAVSLYRLNVNGENASEVNQKLSQQLSTLSKLAREHNIPVVITNQVYTSFDEENMELVGRDVPRYWSKSLLKLSEKNDGSRVLEIGKHRSLPEGISAQFKITDAGLVATDKQGLF
ncbi:MAG: DNA repair protein RadB [Candidatus Nanohaloarchaea archaeon]